MSFEERFNAQWISADTKLITNKSKSLDVLEHELMDIKENLLNIEEKQRILANLSKFYV